MLLIPLNRLYSVKICSDNKIIFAYESPFSLQILVALEGLYNSGLFLVTVSLF